MKEYKIEIEGGEPIGFPPLKWNTQATIRRKLEGGSVTTPTGVRYVSFLRDPKDERKPRWSGGTRIMKYTRRTGPATGLDDKEEMSVTAALKEILASLKSRIKIYS